MELDPALEQDMLVLSNDAEESPRALEEFGLLKHGYDVRIPHRLEEPFLVGIIVNRDYSTIMEPWIHLDLLKNPAHICGSIGKVENLDLRELVFQILNDVRRLGEENGIEFILMSQAFFLYRRIQVGIGRYNYNSCHCIHPSW